MNWSEMLNLQKPQMKFTKIIQKRSRISTTNIWIISTSIAECQIFIFLKWINQVASISSLLAQLGQPLLPLSFPRFSNPAITYTHGRKHLQSWFFVSRSVRSDRWDWYSGSCLYHKKITQIWGEYNIHGCLGYFLFYYYMPSTLSMSCHDVMHTLQIEQRTNSTLQYPESNYCKTSSCGGAGHAQYA